MSLPEGEGPLAKQPEQPQQSDTDAEAALRFPAQANILSMISHELRTPLNTINGFLEIVLEGLVGELTPKQREFLGYAHTSTQHLTRLVEDVLLMSKADAGQFLLRLAPLDLGAAIGRTVAALQTSAEASQITLTARQEGALSSVLADELRIQQVLNNLLGNALKFTPAGGSVTITAAVYGMQARVSVCDTGAGLAADELERVFERFYQSPSTAGSGAGSGLGLAIARLIVQQHGGRIWAEQRAGGGAVFRFTLPLAQPGGGEKNAR